MELSWEREKDDKMYERKSSSSRKEWDCKRFGCQQQIGPVVILARTQLDLVPMAVAMFPRFVLATAETRFTLPFGSRSPQQPFDRFQQSTNRYGADPFDDEKNAPFP